MSSKILIVEDEPVASRVLGHLLTSLGHTVKTANSGLDAWMILTGFHDGFDVVFLDLGLPDMDGFDLLRRMRRSGSLRPGRFIMCTAANDRDSVVKAMTFGIRHYIVKPIDPAVVQNKLAEVTGSALAAGYGRRI